jgi:uncharacterized protein YbaP (TraB family)
MILSAPHLKTGRFLDLRLYEQAKQDGKLICSIETVEEQVAVFAQIPLEDQLALLQEIVNEPQAVEKQMQKMIPLYLRRDLSGLLALSADTTGIPPEGQRRVATFFKRLLDDRNQRIAARLLPRINTRSTFIAVGALHLPGPGGLLQLLTDRGYNISIVY